MATISAVIEKDLKEQIEQIAKAEDRSVSYTAGKLLKQALEQNGKDKA